MCAVSLVLLSLVLVSCQGPGGSPSATQPAPAASSHASSSPDPLGSRPTPHSTAPPKDDSLNGTDNVYAAAIREASHVGLNVWLGADLVSRWLEGPKSFRTGIAELGRLASLPNVVGIKIADELGYHDGFDNDFGAIMRFLTHTANALHRVAPGKLILIDISVPQLGCAPGVQAVALQSRACMVEDAARYPALTLPNIDRMFASHTVDVVDLSTFLADPTTYASWGISLDAAQQAAWHEAIRRGWQNDVTLQSRKAMAFPGSYRGTAQQVAQNLRTYAVLPTTMGAQAVDIWTWRQTYDGHVVHLTNPGLAPNALWDGLVRLHRQGIDLFTHFTPSSVEESVPADLRELSRAFSDVFMAAGIG